MNSPSLQESALPDVGWPEERLASLKSEFKNQLVGTLHRAGSLSGEVIIMVVSGVET
jgi:hypothetical protein